MAKLIKCKTCGADIAKSAKTCPACGAKNKKGVLSSILLVFLLLIIVGAVLGEDSEPETSGNSNANTEISSPATPSTEKIPEQEKKDEKETNTKNIFGVGEKVELNNVAATLIGITESYGENYFEPTEGHVFVICEFEIENNTTSDVAISSLLSFEAYFDDYASNIDITAITLSGKTQLDGTVAAGKKMRGVVGYQAPEDWDTVELHFSPSVWSSKRIIFTYSK